MQNRKFHIRVKPFVDRVIIKSVNGKYIADMHPLLGADDILEDYKIFNGSVECPKDFTGSLQVILSLLIGDGCLESSVSQTLSLPISENNNFIIVNDIGCEAKACIVTFSNIFASVMNIERNLELVLKPKGALKKEWGYDNKELMARGIDPRAQNFISEVKLHPQTNISHLIDDLDKEMVIIKLYGDVINIDYVIEN